ncbi:hypothetical protein EF908_00350 [Streptomyces sp. WAC04770]|nr:hypothetical protein [Streptomyces sp. WAC04770]RST25311.1 hypothetical protein EF908_00350 [Streptomyces sp. WAC04770]
MDGCVFCGARANSKEHVVPQWLTRQIPTAARTADESWGRYDDGGNLHMLPPRKAGTTTVKCVCTSCNSGWMSSLEAGVQPFLYDLMIGERTLSLSTEQQGVLAAWALKTLMMLVQTQPEKYRSAISAADHTLLGQNHRLSTRRMIARAFHVPVPGDESSCTWVEGMVRKTIKPYRGFIGLLRIGTFAVRITSLNMPGGMEIAPMAPLPHSEPLWPVQQMWSWPPYLQCTADELDVLRQGSGTVAYGKRKG